MNSLLRFFQKNILSRQFCAKTVFFPQDSNFVSKKKCSDYIILGGDFLSMHL
jgi:hypothetical protein